ncbi:hypothetical protein A2V55_02350 [Candidatus Woesebacteria bacterium RBG_19FT_COMBO_37_29]|uniref:Glycosyltransferase RgtA/B/C/D-like domain-containing protein n=1 Tax=Candidatus Woesebacteria bacterium RBG_19FT_COMBO_37_29 TaxID=1802486 RepID=A0A1F7XM88_9BACT|nr:MAG: hypothetical protein A2V55_02350 [Candidatus Woesebacteria bacterium RBG_19FT_COMBO_37_29]
MRKGIMPYEFSFPYKPPMIIYTHLLSQVVFGDVIWGPRVLNALASIAVIVLVGLIAKKEFGKRAAWISVFLLSIMLILPVNFGGGLLADVYYAAVTEIFMLVPITLLLYLYVLKRGKANVFIWLISGILSAIAIGYKPICPFILGFIYLFWIIDSWKEKNSIKNILIRASAAFIGLAGTLLIMFIPFLLSDGGRAFWHQMFGFSTCFVGMSSNNFGLGQLVHRLFIMAKYYWVLYIVLGYFIVKRPKNWIFYSGLLAVSFLSVYYSLIGHYFLQIMPFFALVGAYGIDILLKEKIFTKINSYLVIVFILLTILLPIKDIFAKTPGELGLWVYGPYDPFYEAQIVGNKIKEITKPDDYIYLEGPDPEIVYFAQRKNAVRMEWPDFMASTCPALKSDQQRYLSDIENNSPEVIILCIYGSCGYLWDDKNAKYFTDYLINLVNKNYEVVGGWMPNGTKGYWLEPIGPDEIPHARLVVYKKK